MPRVRISYRSRAIFNEPGLFLVVGAKSYCVLPLPSRRT